MPNIAPLVQSIRVYQIWRNLLYAIAWTIFFSAAFVWSIMQNRFNMVDRELLEIRRFLFGMACMGMLGIVLQVWQLP